MNRFKFGLAFTAAILLCFCTSLATAYTIEGNTVYEENGNFYISQTPHTLTALTNYVVINFTNKADVTRYIDVAFGFQLSTARPTNAWLWKESVAHVVPTFGNVTHSYHCDYIFNYTLNPNRFWCNSTNGTLLFTHWFRGGDVGNKTAWWEEWEQNGSTTEYYPDYVDVTNKFSKTTWNGKTWFSVQNTEFAPDETKLLKIRVNVNPNTQGKYDLFAKLTGESFQQAWNSGRYILLDPWWGTTCGYSRQFTLTNNNATKAIPANTTIDVQLDHAALVTAGKSVLNGSDIHVVFGNTTELDRFNTTAWNLAVTNVAFMTQYALAAGASDASNYSIFYNCTGNVNALNNISKVFLYGDDFLGATLNDSGQWMGVTNLPTATMGNSLANVSQAGAGVGLKAFLNYTNFEDAYIRYSIQHPIANVSWGIVGFCPLSDALCGNNFVEYGLRATTDDYYYSLLVSGVYTIAPTISFANDGAFHEIKIAALHGAINYYADSGLTFSQGSNPFNAEVASAYFGEDGTNPLWLSIDWVGVAKWIYPEPTITVGAEQTIPTTFYDINVYVTTPANASIQIAAFNTDFHFTSSEPTLNCTSYLDNVYYATRTASNTTHYADAIPALSVGTHNYTVNCTNDTFVVTAVNTSFFTFASGVIIIKTYDEQTNTQIAFNVNIVNASNTTTYTNQYNFNEDNTKIPNGSVRFDITNTSYYPRSYYTTITDTASYTLNAYLINTSATAIFVRFHVRDVNGIPITNASISILRSVGGSTVTVGSQLTDSAGDAAFYMEVGANYYVMVSAATYNLFYTNLNPTTNDYTIILSHPSTGANYTLTNTFEDLQWSLIPSVHSITNETTNITLVVYSANASLAFWGMNVTHNGTLLFTANVTTSPSGGMISYVVNASNLTNNITVEYWFSRSPIITGIVIYWIYETLAHGGASADNGTITQFMKDYKDAGANPITYAIITLIICVIAGAWIYKFNKAAAAVVIICILALGSAAEWLTVPSPLGGGAINGLFVLIFAVLVVGSMIMLRERI